MSAVPVQVASCACVKDDYRPCNGESCSCDSCGLHSDDPMPYAEPMDSVGLDLTSADSWFYYCRPCAFAWILDGADVRAVPKDEDPHEIAPCLICGAPKPNSVRCDCWDERT